MPHIKVVTSKGIQHEIILDDKGLELFNKYTWGICDTRKNNNFYLRRTLMKPKKTNIKFHREITNCPKGLTVDHINHNTLDNRLENLRICTSAENTRNALKRKNSKTKYKGVSKNRTGFQAAICYNKKVIQLGWFKTEEHAARAYDNAAVELFGVFANLNFNNAHDFYII